jgi:hypothetical protein
MVSRSLATSGDAAATDDNDGGGGAVLLQRGLTAGGLARGDDDEDGDRAVGAVGAGRWCKKAEAEATHQQASASAASRGARWRFWCGGMVGLLGMF